MTRIIKRKIHRISEHIYHLIYKMFFNHLWLAFHRDYIIQLFQDNKEKYKWSYRLWPLVVKAELCYFSSPLYSCSITGKQSTLVFSGCLSTTTKKSWIFSCVGRNNPAKKLKRLSFYAYINNKLVNLKTIAYYSKSCLSLYIISNEIQCHCSSREVLFGMTKSPMYCTNALYTSSPTACD